MPTILMIEPNICQAIIESLSSGRFGEALINDGDFCSFCEKDSTWGRFKELLKTRIKDIDSEKTPFSTKEQKKISEILDREQISSFLYTS